MEKELKELQEKYNQLLESQKQYKLEIDNLNKDLKTEQERNVKLTKNVNDLRTIIETNKKTNPDQVTKITLKDLKLWN